MLLKIDDIKPFGVIQDLDHPLFPMFIRWLNQFLGPNEEEYSGTTKGAYYGIGFSYGRKRIVVSSSTEPFKNRIITLERWNEIYNMVTQLKVEEINKFLKTYEDVKS